MAIPDNPITRKETFLAKAAGQGVSTPEPVTREEMYLDAIANSGGGGGGGGGSVTVDSELSATSRNPVQNRVVKAALDDKVDAVEGKGLSTNDYTTTEKSKLAGIQAGAQKNPDMSDYALADDVHSLPAGGTAGQFLVKSSATDYDAAWTTVPNANGVSF